MKILHIHSSDGRARETGAQVALDRLHHALIERGEDSHVLCKRMTCEDPRVTRMRQTLPTRCGESVLNRAARAVGLNEVAYFNAFTIPRERVFQEADVVHLHAMHGDYFSYLALPRLTRAKPVLFTLHDMWPFTGHCTVSHDCERWKTGCGQCPYPDEYPSIRRDRTAWEWKMKDRVYARSSLMVHAISTAQEAMVRESLLGRFPIQMIHHGIDMKVFRPLDRTACRAALDIAPDRFVLLFSAANINRPAKGMDLLRDALRGLPDSVKASTSLMVLGVGDSSSLKTVGIDTIEMGFVRSDELKAILYSAADLFINPSRGESFGLVALESLACGTPTVAFRVGGLTDLVRHGDNGYLADPEDAVDLRAGITTYWDMGAQRDGARARSRASVEQAFDADRITNNMIALYRTLAERREEGAHAH